MIIVFTGEFGYELLNWQGVVRKLRTIQSSNEPLIICSRKGMEHFYETCDKYIDMSEIPTFKDSIANGYMAEGLNVVELKAGISQLLGADISKQRLLMSHIYCQHEGLTWGRGGIYENLNLANNVYAKIMPHLELKSEIEKQVGFNLDEPYTLIQTASRVRANKSNYKLPLKELMEAFPKQSKMILLGFNTLRNIDSCSSFDANDNLNWKVYNAQTFKEQSCLIHYAKKCVFLTEGDYRSHIYLPPFMGKDVYGVAHSSVYNLPTAPIGFWNKHIFQFGGQILPVELKDDLIYNQNLIGKIINE